ncbi:hypothetical protein [Nonomuraea gerenzanensis]|uniref:Uncharacterized protein n=1 Tax=Nonomuraea gerenzanensis TaxID=93944 RepID=A0A1M4EQE4_9ACTN|nr:hypothetical protein [Nonomuraea gerenzanensis]UBU12482.1 hypothetical protein LCN96_50815 [Nonomuraea gerenzanensis]SBP01037.1 hypothetical protein BN4615_P10553 [Nonomuraea gerenzanensis]
MSHTESDLRELLTGRAGAQDGGSARLEEIIRRGRRIRRTRRALAAGAAAVAVTAVALIGLPLRPGAPPVAQQPVNSAEIEPAVPEIPEKFEVRLGAVRFDLPLIHSERFAAMGAGTVTFTPASTSTGWKVLCEDQRAWVVMTYRLKSEVLSGAAGRCGGDGVGGHHDERSAPRDWLEAPQSMTVWVFPGDAPVREVAEEVTGCRPIGKRTDCDESAQLRELMKPQVREELMARVGDRPGRWAVAIYDEQSPTG